MTNKFHNDVDVVMENTEELYTNVDILKQEYLFQLKDEPNLSVFIHLQNVEKLLKQLKSGSPAFVGSNPIAPTLLTNIYNYECFINLFFRLYYMWINVIFIT